MSRIGPRLLLSAIGLVVLGARGFAPATIPAPSGVITGCYISTPAAGTLGALRVIDAASASRGLGSVR